MSTFSEMSIPMLELTTEAYELLFCKCKTDMLNISTSGTEVPLSMEMKFSLLSAAISAAKEELKKQNDHI